MLIVDDLAYYLTGGWFIDLLDTIRDYGLQKKYNVQDIQDNIKENRMLYEFGEISEEEYKKKDEKLQNKLRKAIKIKKNLVKKNKSKEFNL